MDGSLYATFMAGDSTVSQQMKPNVMTARKLVAEAQPFPTRKTTSGSPKSGSPRISLAPAQHRGNFSFSQTPARLNDAPSTSQPFTSHKPFVKQTTPNSFVSAGEMKNGILPSVPKFSIKEKSQSSYSPQVETDCAMRESYFDEFGDEVPGPYEEDPFDAMSGANEVEDFQDAFDEHVEPVSISSSVIAGLQSRSNDPETASEAATSEVKIPLQFQSMFPYPSFNKMQKMVMKELLGSDKHVVICAPTGSGKTVMLEFAIVRTLKNLRPDSKKPVILYLAPLRALCAERVADWKRKFSKTGFVVNELSGDTEAFDNTEREILNTSHLICSTPEKWDWITRRHREITSNVQLILIDEVHTVGAENRGPTLEAVVTRMKMLKTSNGPVRFVAISATAPNIGDIGQWLSKSNNLNSQQFSSFANNGANAIRVFHFDESYRPVPLEKIVVGYSCGEKMNAYSFDTMLNRHLPGLINTHSSGKPTLVFCMSRKSAESAANYAALNMKRSINHQPSFIDATRQLSNQKLRSLLLQGVAYHHAGLAQSDRQLIEQFFISGQLPVLFSTTTLAVGVNLPAHLVIVKSTWHCGPMGATEELSDSDLLQMIGRAGRPQFDLNGRALVLTRQNTKSRYDSLLAGTTVLESYLHRRLVEHLNAEMVLGTIGTVSLALEWIKETFLYVRLSKNPAFYQFNNERSLQKKQTSVDEFLTSLILSALDELESIGVVAVLRNSSEEDPKLRPTPFGRLMARHCIAPGTMRMIMEVNSIPDDSLIGLLGLITTCPEVDDVALRWNERGALNALNKKCKFPVENGVKVKAAKVSVLIQATLGCLPIEHSALAQDVHRIFRVASRVASCLLETVWMRADAGQASFGILQSTCIFSKIIRVQLWHDSQHVVKQLPGIGATLSASLVRNGMVTFEMLANTNANKIDAICGRHAPFGMNLQNAVSGIPRYQLSITQIEAGDSTARISVSVQLTNASDICKKSLIGLQHKLAVLIGDSRNVLLGHYRVMDKQLVESAEHWTTTVTVYQEPTNESKPNSSRSSGGVKVFARVISLELVGCDVTAEFEPKFQPSKTKSVRFAPIAATDPKPQPLSNNARQSLPPPRPPASQNSSSDSSPSSSSTFVHMDTSMQQHFEKLKKFSARLSKKLPQMGEEGDFDEDFAMVVEQPATSSSGLDLACAVVVGKPDIPTISAPAAKKVKKDIKKAAQKSQRQTKIDGYLVPRDSSTSFSEESNQSLSDVNLAEKHEEIAQIVVEKASNKKPRIEKQLQLVAKSSYFLSEDEDPSPPPTAEKTRPHLSPGKLNDLKTFYGFKNRKNPPVASQTNIQTTVVAKPLENPLSNVNNAAKQPKTLPLMKKEMVDHGKSFPFTAPVTTREVPKPVELFDVFNSSLF